MATISGYDSSSISVLFSSLNSGSSKSSSGVSDLLGINYSDYATIRNGSYTKLLKAYYAKETSGSSDTSSTAKSNTTTATSQDSTSLLGKIESATGDLQEASEALLKNGSGSVFTKTQTTGSDGTSSYGYDTDKIYKAVKKFVDGYNDTVKQAGESATSSIGRSVKSLENLTKANESLLKSVGITIGTDNQLSINEDTFKKSDMGTVKSLFHSSGAYGYQASVQAGMIESYAKSEAEKSNTYTSSGLYTYNYSTGTLYNTGV